MRKILLALLAPALAACASTGDYKGATPAPVADTDTALTPPVAAPGALQAPIGQVDTFQVIPAPPRPPLIEEPPLPPYQAPLLVPQVVTTPMPGDTVWRPLSQGGTLQPYHPYRPIHLN